MGSVCSNSIFLFTKHERKREKITALVKRKWEIERGFGIFF